MKARPVILSGGSGVRLWPLSRKYLAKQFVEIFQENSSLFLNTFRRVSSPFFSKPLIVSNIDHKFEILKLIKKFKLNTHKIILESIQKNTAPACAFATFYSEPEEILCIMPSDHFIGDEKHFTDTLINAVKLANKNYIVTIGAKATEPNSDYGYILPVKNKKIGKGLVIKKFVEKPSESTAKKLIKNKCLWNTGILVIKNKVLKELFLTYNRNLFQKSLKACETAKKEKEFYILNKSPLKNIKKISIDYAILEKDFQKLVIPFKGKWSDLGTYNSLAKIKNSYGNVLSIKSKNNFTYSDQKLLVVSGIKDQIIVNTSNAILVTNKNDSFGMRNIIKLLIKLGYEEALNDSLVSRPWGFFENIKNEKGYKVKKLLVLPGEKISLQKHLKRSEHWVVVAGTALVTKGSKKFVLKTNESTFIKKGEIHRIENNTKKDLVLIEVQTGNYLEEDDIYRFEDEYNRTK